MKPIEIAKDIYDVGVNDWNIRDFHGYSTYQGTSYNAFLIVDEKIALIDTVKKEFSDQLLENIAIPKRLTMLSATTRKWIIPAVCHGSCIKLGKTSLCIVQKWG